MSQDEIEQLSDRLENVEGWLMHFAREMDKLWKSLGGGVAILAIVIALCTLLG